MTVDWPSAFDRTPPDRREPYPHNFRVSQRQAFENVITQLKRMEGVSSVRIDTAASRGQKSTVPPADIDPDDPAVVVRFRRDGDGYVVPCDRWSSVRDNAQAIAKYIDAKRALDRYGVETRESEFGVQKVRVE